MTTHINCPHCGTGASDGGVQMGTDFLVVDDMPTFEITIPEEVPLPPDFHLAPNRQDYVPNHRKQRRGKHKRSGRG